jgi:FXSXX-COOH protein
VNTESDLPVLNMDLKRLRAQALDSQMAKALRRILAQLDSGVEPVAGFQSAI